MWHNLKVKKGGKAVNAWLTKVSRICYKNKKSAGWKTACIRLIYYECKN